MSNLLEVKMRAFHQVVFFLVGFIFFFPLVAAPPDTGVGDVGGVPLLGTLSNNSPNPVGGFTLFTSHCLSMGNSQKLVVCSGSTACDLDSPLLCSSPHTTGQTPFCSAPATLNQFGYSPISGSCCQPNNSCEPLTASSVGVGISEFSVSPSALFSLDLDFRQTSIAHRGSNEWFITYPTTSGSVLRRSIDNGKTWSPSFSLISLIAPSSIPSGVNFSDLVVTQPTLEVSPDKGINLVFTLRDSSDGKSVVRYARCDYSNSCLSLSEWKGVTDIVKPSLTVDPTTQKWKYSFSRAKLIWRNAKLHVFFDDAQTNLSIRFHGIFHYVCGVDCEDTPDSWFPSIGGPDLLNGFHNGYPRLPMPAVNANGSLVVVWLDNLNPVSPGVDSIFYSVYGDANSSWSSPTMAISDSGVLGNPFVAGSSDSFVLMTTLGNALKSYECDSICLSNSSRWSEDGMTAAFDGFSPFNSYIVYDNPLSPGDRLYVVSGASAGPPRVRGMLSWQGQVVGPVVLTPFSSDSEKVAGLSSFFGGANQFGFEQAAFSLFRGSKVSFVSTGVLDSQNTSPSVLVTHPQSPQVLVLLNPTLPVKVRVEFDVSEVDWEDELYATIALSRAPNTLEYPLLSQSRLSSWVNLPSTTGQCQDSGVVGGKHCAIDAYVYRPQYGIFAPDGSYTVVVQITDPLGGSAISSSPAQVSLDLSLATMSLLSPLSNEAWSSQTTNAFHVVINNPLFANFLRADVVATSSGQFGVPIGFYQLATIYAVSPYCTRVGTQYDCTIPYSNSPALSEGVYTFSVSLYEDTFSNTSVSVYPVTVDYDGPHLTQFSPSGTVTTIPPSVSFTLGDYSGVGATPLPQVEIGGIPISSVSCSNGSDPSPSVSCSASFPSSIPNGSVSVIVTSHDGLGNLGTNTFAFELETDALPNPTNGPPGDSSISPPGSFLDSLVNPDSFNGMIQVPGIPFWIPSSIVETIANLSSDFLSATMDLIEVTGPSAQAVFIGLCVLAGMASDGVYRRIFSTQIRSDIQRQRDRLLRTGLAGIFFVLPMLVGWHYSLAIGFLFVVMEVAGFLGAAYTFKVLQFHETFGFKPVKPVPDGNALKP